MKRVVMVHVVENRLLQLQGVDVRQWVETQSVILDYLKINKYSIVV